MISQPSSSSSLSSLELSDTKVYETEIRALLATASHFCEVFVLKSRTVPNHKCWNRTARTRPRRGRKLVCTCGHSTRCTADLLSQVKLPGRHQLEGLMRLKFGHVPPLKNWPRNIRGPPCGLGDVEQREKTTHPGTGQREHGQGGMMQATCSLPTFVINSPIVTTPNQSSAPYLIIHLKLQRIRYSSNKIE